jgi:hypothetical protein
VTHVAGRGADAADDDCRRTPSCPLLRTSVTTRSARSSVLGLFAQTAWYREGLGCVLADERPALEAPAPVADDGGRGRPRPAARRRGRPGLRRALGTRAVVVLADGRLVAERYADGFDAGTRQLGWSMGKSVTSAMVAGLVAAGELDLDDADLLPAGATTSGATSRWRTCCGCAAGWRGTRRTAWARRSPRCCTPPGTWARTRRRSRSTRHRAVAGVQLRQHQRPVRRPAGAHRPRHRPRPELVLEPLGMSSRCWSRTQPGASSARPTCGRRRATGRASASGGCRRGSGRAGSCSTRRSCAGPRRP